MYTLNLFFKEFSMMSDYILDSDLSKEIGVTTKAINADRKANPEKFPVNSCKQLPNNELSTNGYNPWVYNWEGLVALASIIKDAKITKRIIHSIGKLISTAAKEEPKYFTIKELAKKMGFEGTNAENSGKIKAMLFNSGMVDSQNWKPTEYALKSKAFKDGKWSLEILQKEEGERADFFKSVTSSKPAILCGVGCLCGTRSATVSPRSFKDMDDALDKLNSKEKKQVKGLFELVKGPEELLIFLKYLESLLQGKRV
jgi:hypothetical protein